MKPLFIDDWPNVQEDHNEISQKIINVFEEHQKRKIKNKEMKVVEKDKDSDDKKQALLKLKNEDIEKSE